MRLLFQAEEKTKEAAADDVDEMPATTEKNDANDNDDGSSTSAPAAPHAPDTLLEYVLTHYRGLLCLFFLLPLSVAFELFLYLRNTVNFLLRARAPKKHAAKVRAICDQVRAWGRDQEEATGEKQKKERQKEKVWFQLEIVLLKSEHIIFLRGELLITESVLHHINYMRLWMEIYMNLLKN